MYKYCLKSKNVNFDSDSFSMDFYKYIQYSAEAVDEFSTKNSIPIKNVIIIRTDTNEVLVDRETNDFYFYEIYKFKDILTSIEEVVVKFGHKVFSKYVPERALKRIIPRTTIIPSGGAIIYNTPYLCDTVVIDNSIKPYLIRAKFCDIETIRREYIKSSFEKTLFKDFKEGNVDNDRT